MEFEITFEKLTWGLAENSSCNEIAAELSEKKTDLTLDRKVITSRFFSSLDTSLETTLAVMPNLSAI
ncbi:MAG: hypothetical protein WC408_00065 [Candidatus Micrarchaeia archaeon]